MKRKLSLTLAISIALLASLLMVMTVAANPPAPDDHASIGQPTDILATRIQRSASKTIDQPNAKDYLRLRERQRLLEAGQTAEAAALAQTGTDRVLVILVEFAGADVFTWNPGDQWDPLGIADPNEYTGVVGDCSNIITQTQTFTYTGPLHNAMPRPVSAADRSGDSIWTEDFSVDWFHAFMFGDGVTFDYTRQDGSVVHEDFTGQSVKNYYLDLSAGQYDIHGDVIGWVQVPHSTWYYDADECPGSRSGARTRRGAIPGAGTARTLVKDALDAVNAISDTIPGFDWANYDLDGDGVIDRLWIVHAGYGEEDGTTLLNRTDYGEAAVWSHSSAVSPPYQVAPGIAAGPYIAMPENGGIGVFAHEYGHNLGAWDLYAYGNGETSAGFWTLMADDWTGYPIGFEPPAVDAMHLDWWGWLDPLVVDDPSQEYIVTLGQASDFPGGDGVYRGAKIELEEGLLPLAVPVWQGKYYWWGGKVDQANASMTSVAPIAIPAGGATFSFDLVYDIEAEWDFLWVQVSEDGENWDTLTNANTQCVHDPGWIGGLYGFPEDLCGAGLGGFYGYNANWPDPELQTFGLSAYAGKSVYLRFWFMTDWGTTYTGAFVDNVKVTADGAVLFEDDAESGDAKWTYQGPWQRSNGEMVFKHNIYLQWRNVSKTGGYDSALGESRWRFGPANSGLLVWYNNTFYTDNEVFSYLTDYPGWGPKGNTLVVDAHPEPYRDPDLVAMGYNNEGGNLTSRGQMRDAPFSLNDSVSFEHTDPYQAGALKHTYPGRPAVSSFHDSMGYYPGAEYVNRGPAYPPTQFKWVTRQWDASTVVPAKAFYGIKAPGYTANEQFRFACSPYLSGPNTGYLGCYWYGASGLGYAGGTGNPGDIAGQYGWHVEILSQTDQTATVRIWNAMNDFDGAVTQTPNTDPVIQGSVIDVDVAATNIGSALDGFFFLPLSPGVEYVPGSAYGGAFPLTANAVAALAAERGIQDLAPMASAAAVDGAVVGVAYMAPVGASTAVDFGFHVRVTANSGMIHHSVTIFDGAHFVKALYSDSIEIEPAAKTVTETFLATGDTFIARGLPADNYGRWAFLYVGAKDALRSLAQFDFSAINPAYPVDQATLWVYVDAFSGADKAAELRAYEVTTPWDADTATWKTPWTTAGGDYVEPAAGAVAISSADVGSWIELDITPLVQKWVADPASNQGLVLREQATTKYTRYRLTSSDYWFAEFGPHVQVTYRTP